MDKKMNPKMILGGRVIAVLPALSLQVLWLYLLFTWLSPYSALIQFVMSILAFFFVLYIVSNRDDGAYKVLWLMVILPFPILGATLYLLFGDKRTGRPLERKLKESRKTLLPLIFQEEGILQEIKKENIRIAQIFDYVHRISDFPVLRNGEAIYYPIGEKLFEAMISEMKKAQKFIFVEYFIVEDGKLWKEMVDVMEKKVEEGIDVRILYDDVGSISTFSKKNAAQLRRKGIRIVAFNPLKFLSGALNNRDHRKMLVIDNRIAFSGGMNLADEYINEIRRFGHWKDVGFRIRGKAVQSYTFMFCEFWNAFSEEKIEYEIEYNEESEGRDGFVLPYYDSPVDEEPSSYNLYIEMLESSTNYIWFYTPYLILGEHLLDSMIRTAKRGIDVRIFMPGIPDKRTVYEMSRSYYEDMLKAGVKIYEYSPGFLHAKACLTDDVLGTVGTVNLDYRSLFLHFECSALFYRAELLKDLKRDMLETQSKSVQRTLNDRKKTMAKRIADSIKRIIAPLC